MTRACRQVCKCSIDTNYKKIKKQATYVKLFSSRITDNGLTISYDRARATITFVLIVVIGSMEEDYFVVLGDVELKFRTEER